MDKDLERVIFYYLDSQNFVILNNKNKFNNYIYFLDSITDDVAQISIFDTNAFGEVRNWVYVNNDLIDELRRFFLIDEIQCLETIKIWVSDTLGIKVNKIENPANTGSHHRLYL